MRTLTSLEYAARYPGLDFAPSGLPATSSSGNGPESQDHFHHATRSIALALPARHRAAVVPFDPGGDGAAAFARADDDAAGADTDGNIVPIPPGTGARLHPSFLRSPWPSSRSIDSSTGTPSERPVCPPRRSALPSQAPCQSTGHTLPHPQGPCERQDAFLCRRSTFLGLPDDAS